MKTHYLKLTMIVALLLSATFAKGYNISRYDVESTNDLKKAIQYMVKTDFRNTDGFLVKNAVYRMKEKVETEFVITKDSKIKIVKVNCPDCVAEEYVRSLLDKRKIKATDDLLNKRYKVVINIDYKS